MLDETILEKLKSKEYEEYFNLFGEKAGIDLLCKKRVTVNKMILGNQVKLMYYWYQKTGYKFIPDYVVMQNFPINEIDNFLENGKIWSRLMKISEFSEVHEGRLALLKLSYIYGIFHGNIDSINHLEFLLKGIPLKISNENYEMLIWSEDRIKYAKKYNFILPSKEEIDDYYYLKNELENKKIISKDSEYIFKELYKTNDNEIYNLQFNYQMYPIIVKEIRNFMEKWGLEVMLDPFKAFNMVKDFKMDYDDDFRKFFIDNIDFALTNFDYMVYLSKIQNEFDEIKKLNSNRKLTYELALNFVKGCSYKNINVGNEMMADTIGKIGLYSQNHFDTLQKIYNYGKIRVFSSIPRISGVYKEYSYEMLKLDDPLALVIGNLTDCCQRLNDNAELCMEHSMVDNDGRVFVVKDKFGQIVSQSWVWRNKNVLCFDDIEIPNKLLVKKERSEGGLIARYMQVEEIYEVYKKASSELIDLDNKTYFALLVNKQITKKQYYGLKLNKVIVGLGNNDIASVIKSHASYFGTNIVRPLPFNPPVKLTFYPSLYLKDSIYQYILSENEETFDFNLDNLSIYNDEYTIYDNSNITKVELAMLENLIKVTDLCNDKILLGDYKQENIINVITSKYGIEVDKVKLIIHPNFSIIYEEDERTNNILDIFFNTKIENKEQQIDITDIVMTQIKLALVQINNNKELNISKLSLDKQELCSRISIEFDLKKTQSRIMKKVLVK